jgi:hypothetical protein
VADFPFKSLQTIDNKPLNHKDNVRNALRKKRALTRPNKCPLVLHYCHLASKRPLVILRISGVAFGFGFLHLKLNVPATVLFGTSSLVMFTVPVSVMVVTHAWAFDPAPVPIPYPAKP